ncbi:hypothetical protein NH340_JMT05226 [Sarcoptes scabiei]|nr:hypothetical protein NH340_JMT05226 [Sarcoptes scabiei]
MFSFETSSEMSRRKQTRPQHFATDNDGKLEARDELTLSDISATTKIKKSSVVTADTAETIGKGNTEEDQNLDHQRHNAAANFGEESKLNVDRILPIDESGETKLSNDLIDNVDSVDSWPR